VIAAPHESSDLDSCQQQHWLKVHVRLRSGGCVVRKLKDVVVSQKRLKCWELNLVYLVLNSRSARQGAAKAY
jgi:hypothetical protein